MNDAEIPRAVPEITDYPEDMKIAGELVQRDIEKEERRLIAEKEDQVKAAMV